MGHVGKQGIARSRGAIRLFVWMSIGGEMIEYVLSVSVSFLFSAIYDLWKNERLTERRTRGARYWSPVSRSRGPSVFLLPSRA